MVCPNSELVHRVVVPVQVKTGKQLLQLFVPEGTGLSQNLADIAKFLLFGTTKSPKAAYGILPFLLQNSTGVVWMQLQGRKPHNLRDKGSNLLVIKIFFL